MLIRIGQFEITECRDGVPGLPEYVTKNDISRGFDHLYR